MSSTFMAIVGVMYLFAACNQFMNGNYGLGITFVGWTIGQIGMYSVASIK